MKRFSVILVLAFLVFMAFPAVSAPPPPNLWDPPSILGNWAGTGKILAPDLELDDITVILNVTGQSGSRFYGTMSVKLTYGVQGTSYKCFWSVWLGDLIEYSCPIAGIITNKGELSISGATTYSTIEGGTLDDPLVLVPTMRQDATASLSSVNSPAGKSSKIEGNFRATVTSYWFRAGPFVVFPQLNPPHYEANPSGFRGAAFSGTFNLQKILRQ